MSADVQYHKPSLDAKARAFSEVNLTGNAKWRGLTGFIVIYYSGDWEKLMTEADAALRTARFCANLGAATNTDFAQVTEDYLQ